MKKVSSSPTKLALLLSACLILLAASVGLAMRLQLSDISSHPGESDRLRFATIPLSEDLASQRAEAGASAAASTEDDGSAIVAEVRFEGERTYAYKAFVSQVRVKRVIDGPARLVGASVKLYEPYGLGERRGVKIIDTSGPYACGVLPMREDCDYLVRIAPAKELPTVTGRGRTYRLLDDPFAKISLEGDLGVYEVDDAEAESLTLGDVSQHDVVVSRGSGEWYATRAAEVIRSARES